MTHSTDTNCQLAFDPASAATLVELLRWRAEHQPERHAYTFLHDGETVDVMLSYQEVDRRARTIAARLQQCATSGSRALLLYPPGVEYICAFFGCLYAGVVAVPAYPPQSARLERSLPRLRSIVMDCAPTVALTTAAIHERLAPALSTDSDFQALVWLATDRDHTDLAEHWRAPALDGETLAFLQYTSGSTAAPKGVMVSHCNLLHNQGLIRQGFGHDHHTTVVGWLPLYHDMGLIGNVLQPLYLGAPCILMSPIAFLQRPIRWLQAISSYRATSSGGPNFAYDLCVSKITPEQRATLDLSSWAVAFNGAEPVRAETLERFAAAFAECGFRRDAFYPCYGLAETTLIVSGGAQPAPPVVGSFAGSELEHNHVVAPGAEQPGARMFVGCGSALGEQRVVVVDPEAHVLCQPDRIGEIWVAGPSVAQGYWERPEATAQTFHARLQNGDGPFLRTGDLGFFRGGELFIAGRLKDLIIIRGRNYYPQDIELTVERSHAALQPNATAAFAAEIAGEERLVIVQEVERQHRATDLDLVVAAIRQAISEQHELQAYAIVLLKPGSIPKTSSGKIQRHLCRSRFLANELVALHQSTIDSTVTEPESTLDRETLLAAGPEQRLTLIEAYLRDLVARTLGVAASALASEQPLSSFGIDSLAAVELQNRVELDLGATIPMVQFLQGFSSAEVAQQILDRLVLENVPLQPIDRSAALPLSFAQQRMWLLEQLAPGAATYSIPVMLRLSGSLDSAALEQSLIALVRRHESLRTTFSPGMDDTGDDALRQVIAPVDHAPAIVSLPIIDLEQVKAQDAEIERLAIAEARRPFDLAVGPLLRTTLLKLGAAEHLLLLTLHHSVADGWSMNVFARDLAALYAATRTGTPAMLHPDRLPIQYADFAVWQREWLSGAVLEQQLGYWRQHFAGDLPVLDLPTDRPRPAIQTFRGGRETLTLTADLADALKLLSQQHDATLFMTLLAAFNILLSRHSGQHDIIVGTPIAGRTRAQLEHVIGCFVNTLALRTDLSGDLSFHALLSRVRAVCLGAYAHQDLPFEHLLDALNLERDPSRSPLFQVFFNLLSVPERQIERGGLSFELAAQPAGAIDAKFDITIYAQERNAAIDLELVYNADLFDPARMTELLQQLRHLLMQIAAQPELPIDRLSLVTTGARSRLPDPQLALPIAESGVIHERFVQQARRAPERIALVDHQDLWSYAELDDWSDRLAARLSAEGIRRQDLVAIYAHRSAALVWALLGVLKAGAAFVILDPAYPALRLVECLRTAQPRGWIQIEAAGTAPDALVEYLDLLAPRCRLTMSGREAAQDVFAEPVAASGVTVNPDDLAYVAFTSGSTGAPKAILGTHRPLTHFLDWQTRAFELTSDDRFSLLAGLAHDPLLRDIFTPITSGATLCIPAPELLAEPERLAQWIDQQRISVAHLTPAHGQLLASATHNGRATLPMLRYAFFGGDRLSQREIVQLRLLAPQAICVNCYGATETPQVMGYFVVDPSLAASTADAADPCCLAAIPLGRGIDGAQLLILNQSRQLAGIGELGEIAIRTPYLTLGYLNDEVLTQSRFSINPFIAQADRRDRLYHTGDLGRYLPDGTVVFAGRADQQIKLRGFRVELAEIESVLRQHPAVRETVVLAQDSASGDPRLVAYVVEEQPSSDTAEQHVEQDGSQPQVPGARPPGIGTLRPKSSSLRSFLSDRLPAYMVPSAFVTLDRLPLTPNGKLDRKALPEPEDSQITPQDAFVPARTPTEEIAAAIWAEVLDRSVVGVHDNFFSLGGHSLLAARLMARLRGAFGVDLPLRALFEAPTVARLAQTIEQRRGGSAAVEVELPSVVVDPVLRYEPFPLTDIQQAYWIGRSQAFELGNVSTHTYLELAAIDLDLARFNRAWQRLIDRHEMLRAIVRSDGTQQILAEVPAYRIEALDLRDQAPESVTMQLAAIRERMSHQLLPSDRWPLFEIRATLLDRQLTRLHISMDALVSDAWSRQILARELSLLYEQPAAALPALDLSFRDYVLAETALHKTDLYRRSLEYWRERLPTLPPGPDLPLAQNPSALLQPRFVRRSARLEPEAWRRLRARAAHSGLTPSGVLLAAFAEVLATWSKHPRFTINLTLFNRLPLHPQVNAIMGDFTSVTLLAIDLSGRDSFAARAGRLQAQLWDDLDHRYVSGVRVLRELARTQDGLPKATMPVVFTSTLIQGAAGQGLAALSRIGEIAYSISQTPQVWLDHQVFEQGGTLVFNWDAVEDLFPSGLLDAMFGAYCDLLQRLVADETAWQQPLPGLVPPDQLAQRAAINATGAPISEELLHTLFMVQAQAQPQQAAVITTTRSLSYADLNRRATELSHWLRERNARPNTLAAVVMEKGWEQVVAVLGVAMSGAAYLPIDPSLPADRVHYLLDHGQVTLVLTQSWLDSQLVWPAAVQRLCVDTLQLSARAEQPVQPVQQPTDLAYVIYTSGSTGLPKGVMTDHRGAVNTILDLNQRFGVGSRDRVLALSSLSFDLSVYDIFGLLAAGGTIVMPDAAALRDPRHWAQLLSREHVTIWNSVPALMEMFVEYVAERPALHPAALRLVMMSGDWIPVTLPDRIKALSDGINMFSLGGATEASIWSILYPLTAVDPDWRSIPYGKPMVNQQFHVLGESFEPSPIWVPGQLYIGGIGLAQGYWRDPEKTAASFISHPRTGERLYRTGDLGRYLPDGNIEFLGREDFQLKIQGYRIELGEIEAALSQHRLVRNAVVTAIGERQGSKRLVAYVVPEREATAEDVQQIAQLLDPRERLHFKRQQPGLRQEPERLTIPLLRPELDADAIDAAYIRRRSYRQFLASPLRFEQLSLLLSSLAQIAIPGASAPKYRYSSAGSLYPVQIYLHVKPERVAGLSAGTYYYHPAAHQLVLLTPDAAIDRGIHGPANRALFDDAAFSIFLVAQLSAISPMYGADSLRFATLEAGVITHLLESAAPELEIGLCQTGIVDFEQIRELFALEASQVWLHGLVGGAIDPAQMRLPALLADARGYHELTALIDDQQHSAAPLSYALTPAREPLPDSEIVAALREFLKTKLPAYMVPSAFVLLDTLPLSANGKVDRKALPSPEMIPSDHAEGFVAPQSQVEQTIAALLQEVLQLPQVGVNDNFFDLGGNSIHLVQVHGKLQTAFNIEIPLVEMFKHPTVRALANHLSQDLIPPAPPAAPEPPADRGKQRLNQMLKRSSR